MQMLFSKKWAFVAVGEGPAFFNTWNTETHSSMSMLGWRNAWFQVADGGCGSTRRGRNGTGASAVWRGHPPPSSWKTWGRAHVLGLFLAPSFPPGMWNGNHKPTGGAEEPRVPVPESLMNIGCSHLPTPFCTPKKKKKKRSESEVSRTC